MREGENRLQDFLVPAQAQLIEHQRQENRRRKAQEQFHQVDPQGNPHRAGKGGVLEQGLEVCPPHPWATPYAQLGLKALKGEG